MNGKSFWLIETKLNRDSKILAAKNINGNLTLLTDDSKLAIINEGINSEILDLNIKNIDSIYFLDDKVIAIQKNGKIGVF